MKLENQKSTDEDEKYAAGSRRLENLMFEIKSSPRFVKNASMNEGAIGSAF